jgi:hypothetical protein
LQHVSPSQAAVAETAAPARPRVRGRVSKFSRAHADEGGRIGFSLGEVEGERGGSGHAVGENDVAVDVDDGNRDGYVLFDRLGLDAVSNALRDGE